MLQSLGKGKEEEERFLVTWLKQKSQMSGILPRFHLFLRRESSMGAWQTSWTSVSSEEQRMWHRIADQPWCYSHTVCSQMTKQQMTVWREIKKERGTKAFTNQEDICRQLDRAQEDTEFARHYFKKRKKKERTGLTQSASKYRIMVSESSCKRTELK